MKSFILILVFAILSPWASVAQAGVQEQPAYKQLAEVKMFGFGFVALSGTARGQILLLQVLKQDDAVKQLMEVYNEGTPEGKLYALAGFHVIAPELFEICRKDIVGHYNPMVHEWQGCLRAEVSFLGPLIRIAKGEYDVFLQPKRSR